MRHIRELFKIGLGERICRGSNVCSRVGVGSGGQFGGTVFNNLRFDGRRNNWFVGG
jgi:hypothetical protein